MLRLIACTAARAYTRGIERSFAHTIRASGAGSSRKAVVPNRCGTRSTNGPFHIEGRPSGTLLTSSTTTSGRSAPASSANAPFPSSAKP